MTITELNVTHSINEYMPTIQLNIEIKFEENEQVEADKVPLSLACYRFLNDETISLPSWTEERNGTSFRDYDRVTAKLQDDLTLLAGNIYTYTIEVYHGDTGLIASTTYSCPFFFEYSHLIDKNRNLILKYNQEISSYKPNVIDVVTPTLGGEYPFIRRNGAQKYRSFNLNGLICLESENDEVDKVYTNTLFFNNEEKEKLTQYKGFLDNNIIQSYYDYRLALERYYREKVLAFLQAPTIKLFKSMQEGDIFVYLSNVSLTPDKVSGRALYSFSCQATEVGKDIYDKVVKSSERTFNYLDRA